LQGGERGRVGKFLSLQSQIKLIFRTGSTRVGAESSHFWRKSDFRVDFSWWIPSTRKVYTNLVQKFIKIYWSLEVSITKLISLVGVLGYGDLKLTCLIKVGDLKLATLLRLKIKLPNYHL
ncbi:MAG: hypothetical protein GY820_22660, partial [Gammaproteobacteria bacterium]|nr:hypothetical protein [Gammaproteobacteria bacterium]